MHGYRICKGPIYIFRFRFFAFWGLEPTSIYTDFFRWFTFVIGKDDLVNEHGYSPIERTAQYVSRTALKMHVKKIQKPLYNEYVTSRTEPFLFLLYINLTLIMFVPS